PPRRPDLSWWRLWSGRHRGLLLLPEVHRQMPWAVGCPDAIIASGAWVSRPGGVSRSCPTASLAIASFRGGAGGLCQHLPGASLAARPYANVEGRDLPLHRENGWGPARAQGRPPNQPQARNRSP